MEKKAIKKVAAVVVHPETGEEHAVTHQIDVQGWIDLGYEVKGSEAPKEELHASGGSDENKSDENKSDEKTGSDETGSDQTGSGETSYDEMDDATFLEAVKDKLHDIKADDAKRVAQIVGLEYTNKKDTMNAVLDKWAEDL